MTKDGSTKRPYKKSKHKKKGKKKKDKDAKKNKLRAASKASKRVVEDVGKFYRDNAAPRQMLDPGSMQRDKYPDIYRNLITQTMYLNGDVAEKKQTNTVMIIEQYVKDKIQEIVVSCLNNSTEYQHGGTVKLELQDILFHFRHNPQRVRRIFTFVIAKSKKSKTKQNAKGESDYTKRNIVGNYIPDPLTPAHLQRDAFLTAYSENGADEDDDDEDSLSAYSIIKPEDYFTNTNNKVNNTLTDSDRKGLPKVRPRDASDVVTQNFQGIYRLANPLHKSTITPHTSIQASESNNSSSLATPIVENSLNDDPLFQASDNPLLNTTLFDSQSSNSLLSTTTPLTTPIGQSKPQRQNPLIPRTKSYMDNMYLVRDEDRQRKIALENLENDMSFHEYRNYHKQQDLIYKYAQDPRTFKEWVGLDRLYQYGKPVKFSHVVIDALAFIAWELASLVTQTSLIVQRSMHLMPSTIREHHLGQATGIMTQDVRRLFTFVPDESARELAQSFASVASAPRHPPIIPAHVFEAIRRCQHYTESIQCQPSIQLY